MKIQLEKKIIEFFKAYWLVIVPILILSIWAGFEYGKQIQKILLFQFAVVPMSLTGGSAVGITVGAIIIILCLFLILVPRSVSTINPATGRQLSPKKVSFTGLGLTMLMILLTIGGIIFGFSFILGIFEDMFGQYGKYVLMGIGVVIVIKLLKIR